MTYDDRDQTGMRQGPPPCPGGFLYTIRANDTLYSIARLYGITVARLEQANPGINPQALRVGQTICVPLARPFGPPGPPRPAPGGCSPGSVPYVIRSGDTFYSIARRNGITVGQLQRANRGVNPSALRIGQTICVPRPGAAPGPGPGMPGGGGPACVPGARPYVIRAGDTFYSIARNFGVSLEELQRVNPGVNPNRLQVGQLICIPSRRP